MPNIEIKARLTHDRAPKIAQALGGKCLGTDHQIDTYFCCAQGRLKLRESSLSGAYLVPYMRPDEHGPKKSEYVLIPVPDASVCKRLLSTILGVDTVIDKMREIYLIDNVRVHIDAVSGLGNFFELEAVYNDVSQEASEHQKVNDLMNKFEIQDSDLLTGSYREMV